MNRNLWIAGACLVAGATLLLSQGPSDAQGKKNDDKQIQKLQQDLKEKNQQYAKLKLDFEVYKKKNTSNAKLQKDLDKANQSIKDKDSTIATLQQNSSQTVKDLVKENDTLRRQVRDLGAVKKAPFVHTVLLKLKKSDDAQVKVVSDEAAKTIAKIEGVRGVWVGKPAENGTPELAQTGYQLGIVGLLDDADALARYLVDPLHQQFTDQMGDAWERPVVYDFQRDAEKK